MVADVLTAPRTGSGLRPASALTPGSCREWRRHNRPPCSSGDEMLHLHRLRCTPICWPGPHEVADGERRSSRQYPAAGRGWRSCPSGACVSEAAAALTGVRARATDACAIAANSGLLTIGAAATRAGNIRDRRKLRGDAIVTGNRLVFEKREKEAGDIGRRRLRCGILATRAWLWQQRQATATANGR